MWSNISVVESKIITLPKVGDVLLERSYRAKHINISVKPPKKIRVAVPVGVEFEKAHKIAETTMEYIKSENSSPKSATTG